MSGFLQSLIARNLPGNTPSVPLVQPRPALVFGPAGATGPRALEKFDEDIWRQELPGRPAWQAHRQPPQSQELPREEAPAQLREAGLRRPKGLRICCTGRSRI